MGRSHSHGPLLPLQVAAHVLEIFYQHHLKPKRFRVASAADPLRKGKFHGKGSADTRPRLGRRWIMSDLGRFAIHTIRKRLIDWRKLHAAGQPYRAFDVHNLGRYERQWWQEDRLKGAEEEHRKVVLEFFQAEVLTHPISPQLHGRKGAALCHVDSIDGIFTRDEARQVTEAVVVARGREVLRPSA